MFVKIAPGSKEELATIVVVAVNRCRGYASPVGDSTKLEANDTPLAQLFSSRMKDASLNTSCLPSFLCHGDASG